MVFDQRSEQGCFRARKCAQSVNQHVLTAVRETFGAPKHPFLEVRMRCIHSYLCTPPGWGRFAAAQVLPARGPSACRRSPRAPWQERRRVPGHRDARLPAASHHRLLPVLPRGARERKPFSYNTSTRGKGLILFVCFCSTFGCQAFMA